MLLSTHSSRRIASSLLLRSIKLSSNILQRKLMKNVPLTSEIYDVTRGNYKSLDDGDIEYFKTVVKNRIVTDDNDLEMWNTDWMRSVKGQSKVMLKPKTTEEVSKILQYCNNNNIAVCPQGGNTGLVGGSVPIFDEVILSSALMNKVLSVDKNSGIIACQSGCILQHLNNHLEQFDMIIPLDLGSKGSCHIGGNLSTNAGGLRLLRYGSLKGNTIGVEAVLADGTILNSLDVIRKNNTGYDLKQLFIGSEGTLGFITAASILCPQKPSSVQVAFLGVESFDKLVSLLLSARHSLGEILSAVEFQDSVCMDLVHKNLGLQNPIGEYPFYMIIETSGSNEMHDFDKLENFLEVSLSSGLASDGTLASDSLKMGMIWELRERVAEALMKDGYGYKYDISLPTATMYDATTEIRERLKDMSEVITVLGYGHLGDGNLHLNVTTKDFNPDVLSKIEPHILEYTVAHKGSISAEHGIGFKKRKYIHLNQTDECLDMMRNLKNLFDPNQILNPYKVLP